MNRLGSAAVLLVLLAGGCPSTDDDDTGGPTDDDDSSGDDDDDSSGDDDDDGCRGVLGWVEPGSGFPSVPTASGVIYLVTGDTDGAGYPLASESQVGGFALVAGGPAYYSACILPGEVRLLAIVDADVDQDLCSEGDWWGSLVFDLPAGGDSYEPPLLTLDEPMGGRDCP